MKRNFSTITDSLLNPHSVTRGYWTKQQNQRKFFDQLAKVLNIEKADDWYRISPNEIAGFFSFKAITSIYNEHQWRLWKFEHEKKLPSGIWKDRKLHRLFFDDVAESLNMRSFTDWYNVSYDLVKGHTRYGGYFTYVIDEYYDGSLLKALTIVYSDNPWQLWRFPRTPAYFWDNKKNQKDFLDYCWKELKIENWMQWFRVPTRSITTLGGEGLLKKYDGNLIRALEANYPEFNWTPNIWAEKKTQIEVFDFVSKKLGLSDLDGWYKVNPEDLNSYPDATRVLTLYNQSLYQALQSIYPEKEWLPWKFQKIPKNFFDKESNVKQYLLAVEKELNISDWASVTVQELFSIKHIPGLVTRYGGLLRLLNIVLPERNVTKQKSFPEEKQKSLQDSVKAAFPTSTIETNYKLQILQQEIILDIYIVNIKIAFEYQGEEFFRAGKALFESPDALQKEFRLKQQKCKSIGITLIDIPYWWSLTAENIKQFCK